MPNLENLWITSPIAEPAHHTPRLDLKGLNRLRILSIFGFCLRECPVLPSSLERLTIGYGTLWTTYPTGRPIGYSNLKYFELDCMSGPATDVLDHLLSGPMSSLETLHVRGCHSIWGDDFIKWMKEGFLKSITDLNLTNTCDVDDSLVDAVVSTMPNLKHLNLSQTQITGLSVKSLADTENLKLEKLVVRNLATPINRDAIEYGRSRGIHIPPPFSSS